MFGATAALEEGIPLADTPSGALCGRGIGLFTLLGTQGGKAWYLHTACAESVLVFTYVLVQALVQDLPMTIIITCTSATTNS